MNTQFKVEKGTLDGRPTVDQNAMYVVDFTKLESVNDLVIILSAMGIAFPASHPHFEQVKSFLALDNPIPIQQQIVQPEAKEIALPKLKTLR